MKILLVFSLLLPVALFAQTKVLVTIQTLDHHGQELPSCELELLNPKDSTLVSLRTDKNGLASTHIPVFDTLLLTGRHRAYIDLHQKLSYRGSFTREDSIFSTLTFSPIISIQENFSKIDLDKTFAIGNLGLFRDTIQIMTDYEQIEAKQNYTSLHKLSENRYEVLFWLMENGGLVDPAIYKEKLVVKLKDNNTIKLKLGKKKAVYSIKGFQSVDGIYYLLVKQ
jgi:hypothetical protein